MWYIVVQNSYSLPWYDIYIIIKKEKEEKSNNLM